MDDEQNVAPPEPLKKGQTLPEESKPESHGAHEWQGFRMNGVREQQCVVCGKRRPHPEA